MCRLETAHLLTLVVLAVVSFTCQLFCAALSWHGDRMFVVGVFVFALLGVVTCMFLEYVISTMPYCFVLCADFFGQI